MSRNWQAWHASYDDPASSLSRRLAVVREQLRIALADVPDRKLLRLVSMCAGDGRDTLPVLASVGRQVTAVLVELDGELADSARRTASDLGLADVEVRTADAGWTDAYEGAGPADVLLACGVFGNITDADVERTIDTLPTLLASSAQVIWTRGRRSSGEDPTEVAGDPSEYVRGRFAAAGFEEITFVRPNDAGFRVGVHRFADTPEPYVTGRRLFTFV